MSAPTVDLKDLACACYEELLVLESFLKVYTELEQPPVWVFGVSTLVGRALEMADTVQAQLPRALVEVDRGQ